MAVLQHLKNREEYTYHLVQALNKGWHSRFRENFTALHPTEQANIISTVPHPCRKKVYTALKAQELAALFQALSVSKQKTMLSELDEKLLLLMIEAMRMDDVIAFLSRLSYRDAISMLRGIGRQDAKTINMYVKRSRKRVL
jgi:magnesium transporter